MMGIDNNILHSDMPRLIGSLIVGAVKDADDLAIKVALSNLNIVEQKYSNFKFKVSLDSEVF